MGHAIGFVHEHQRLDRDDYVNIIRENMDKDVNYQKYSHFEVDTFEEPYDFDSVMQYGPGYNIYPKIGKNGIRPKIHWPSRLSAIDIKKANKLYNCPICGRTYSDREAAFTAPEYYNISANRTYRCEWRINVISGERIQLKINDLDIFKSSDCRGDYLEIRDGYWYKSPLLGRFCGNNIPKYIDSTGNRMIINYVSSHAKHRDFAASYKAFSEYGDTSPVTLCANHLHESNIGELPKIL